MARRAVAWSSSGEPSARQHRVGAAVAQALEALRVRAVEVVVEVVGDLGPEAGRRLLLAHLEPDLVQQRAAAAARAARADQRAERVEQDRARHAIQCQLANWAVNRPRPTADARATRSVTRRSSHTERQPHEEREQHATKRGSDISGCGITGNESGSSSETATQAPYARGSRLNTPDAAPRARTRAWRRA